MTLFDWPERPAIKRDCRIVDLDPDHIFILNELKSHVFTGERYGKLVSMLDGSHTVDEVCEQLAGEVEPGEVFYAIEQFSQRGLLAARYCSLSPREEGFWHSIQSRPPQAGTLVSVRASAGLDRGPMVAALSDAGVAIASSGETAPLLIVLVRDYLEPELEELNRSMLQQQQTLMLTKPVGQRLWIGPIFHPQHSACWACLAFRLRLNLQTEEFLKRRAGTNEPLHVSRAEYPASIGLAASITALEVARWLGGDRRPSERLMTFDVARSVSEQHAVVRLPQCPVCGDPERYRSPRPIHTTSVAKVGLTDGNHRSATAEETVERLAEQVSPITGIVSWMADTDGAGHGISYNVAAGHNFVMRNDTVDWLRRSIMTRTGGKGMTRAQAQASAIGEAVERYSGVYRGDECVKRASFRELQGDAVDPRDCLLFSEAQYETRVEWNAAQTDNQLHVVPRPFDDGAVVDWTPAWSLNNERFRYFLSSFCYYGHPESATHFFCGGDTNGCAAGNTVEEAAVQGFYELVERDAVAIWWYNRLRRPAVDLDSFNSQYLDRLRAYYRSLGRNLSAIDITTDLAIPTFAAVSHRTDRPVEDIIFGFGAHLDPMAALTSAVIELNQFLPAVAREDGNGRTIYNWPEREAIMWWMKATAFTESYVVPDPQLPVTRRDSFPSLTSSDIKNDLQTCVEIAARRGLETFVLDQSRPDIPMKVCRVIVPGLRHFWRRLATGRLYDVPVAQGWLREPVAERGLNPYSIFI